MRKCGFTEGQIRGIGPSPGHGPISARLFGTDAAAGLASVA